MAGSSFSGDTGVWKLPLTGFGSDAVAKSVSEFAASVSSRHSEEDVLWEICERCISVLGFVDAVIYLMDDSRGVLIQKAAFGPKSPRRREIVAPLEIALGKGIVGSAALHGRAELVSDTRLDPRYIEDDQARLSELAVPIVSDGRVLGVIDSEHPQVGFFTTDHLTVLNAIASICASKVTRARAEARLRELNRELERRVAARTAELTATNALLQQEIAERIRVEAAARASGQRYRESEERFRQAFRSIPAYVTVVRMSDMRVIEVNETATQGSGFTRAEMLGRTTAELNLWVDADDRNRFVELLRAQGFVHAFETRLQAKDGRIDWVIVSAEPIELDGEKCLLSLSLPISERKRAEQELQNALNRERELSRLRSAFVSLVSHEFRTPIGVIHSSAEILERYGAQLRPDQQKEHLQAIQCHAWRMAELMEGVLVFGRAEANRLEFHPAEFDLIRFCRDWATELSRAMVHRCSIRFETPASLPAAYGDASLLRHVVVNLLSNALKYSPPGSEVVVILEARNQDAVISVRDRGIGIPSADRTRLFQAFERGSNTGAIPGTGLGLVVIRRCLNLQKGTIEIDSAEQLGTLATVTVPLFLSPEERGRLNRPALVASPLS